MFKKNPFLATTNHPKEANLRAEMCFDKLFLVSHLQVSMFSLHLFISELAFCIGEDTFCPSGRFFIKKKKNKNKGEMPEVLQVVHPSRSAFYYSPLPLDHWCLVVGH